VQGRSITKSEASIQNQNWLTTVGEEAIYVKCLRTDASPWQYLIRSDRPRWGNTNPDW